MSEIRPNSITVFGKKNILSQINLRKQNTDELDTNKTAENTLQTIWRYSAVFRRVRKIARSSY